MESCVICSVVQYRDWRQKFNIQILSATGEVVTATIMQLHEYALR